MDGQTPETASNGDRITFHATSIAAGGRAALIRGASGTGKSELALRCICMAPTPLLPHQAMLVCDDQTTVECSMGRLFAFAPTPIAGLLEVRGIGIIQAKHAVAPGKTPLVLVVELSADPLDRMPDPCPTVALLGVELPLLRLKIGDGSAPERLLVALGCHSLPATG